MRIFSCILILLTTAGVNALGQSKAPSIYFENVTRDVGTIQQGETIRQVFPFVNRGSGTLTILGVEHS